MSRRRNGPTKDQHDAGPAAEFLTRMKMIRSGVPIPKGPVPGSCLNRPGFLEGPTACEHREHGQAKIHIGGPRAGRPTGARQRGSAPDPISRRRPSRPAGGVSALVVERWSDSPLSDHLGVLVLPGEAVVMRRAASLGASSHPFSAAWSWRWYRGAAPVEVALAASLV